MDGYIQTCIFDIMKKNTFKTTPRHDADEAIAARLYALLLLLTVGSFSVGVVFTYLVMR